MIVIINIIINENNHFTFQCNGQHKLTKHTIVFPIEVGWVIILLTFLKWPMWNYNMPKLCNFSYLWVQSLVPCINYDCCIRDYISQAWKTTYLVKSIFLQNWDPLRISNTLLGGMGSKKHNVCCSMEHIWIQNHLFPNWYGNSKITYAIT
jgi:hypothetical protein